MTIVYARTRHMSQAVPLPADIRAACLRVGGRDQVVDAIEWDVPTTGTVYGTLLNFSGALAALGDALHRAPYQAPPQAPVLYIKPANTHTAYGAPVPVPDGIDALEMGATLGVVIARTASRVSLARVFDHVLGYTLVNDVSVPHESLYRPAIRQKCRDGFCPIGPWIVPLAALTSPDALGMRVYVNDLLRQENSTRNLIRSVAQLVVDVTEFMTLYAGDVLTVGVPEASPRARVGDRVRIEIDGVGVLANTLVPQRDSIAGAPR